MNRGIKALIVILPLAIILSGCATYLPAGVFYTEVKSPAGVASGDVNYTKVGVAKATSIFGLIATGDASIAKAVENGGIRKIKFIDYDVKNTLGIFGEYTTTVYGD